jgi:type I restriction enzyme R subunit
LTKPSPKANKKEEQVKIIAKDLLEKLKDQKLVLDWKKKTRTRADVQRTIEDILFQRLPEPPYNLSFKQEKASMLYQHIFDSYQGAGKNNFS